MEHISGDPLAVGRGAARLLEAALALAELRRHLATLRLPSGTLPPESALTAALADLHADALRAVGRLGEVLEGDADRLYRVAFELLEVDRRAGARGAGVQP
jgi:hypothetical protein